MEARRPPERRIRLHLWRKCFRESKENGRAGRFHVRKKSLSHNLNAMVISGGEKMTEGGAAGGIEEGKEVHE
jgi:hypothetical protein